MLYSYGVQAERLTITNPLPCRNGEFADIDSAQFWKTVSGTKCGMIWKGCAPFRIHA